MAFNVNPYQKAMKMETPEEALDYLWTIDPKNMLEKAHMIEPNMRARKLNGKTGAQNLGNQGKMAKLRKIKHIATNLDSQQH